MPLQSFGTPREKQVFTSNVRKTEFLDLSQSATVRILTNGYLPVQTHYVNRSTVQCLGDDCPICSSNKMLIMQYPETFREESKYAPRRTVNLVNVLDKTPVRTCDCGKDVVAKGQSVTTCSCGKVVTGDIHPSNKVKVLSKGVTLFEQLDAINNAILDDKGERVGLTGYDITFIVSGEGKTRIITPITGQISPLPEVPEDNLFDLETVTIKLTASELVDLQRGVSLKDIFSARRASEKNAGLVTDFAVSDDILNSVQSDVESLFK